MKSKVIVPAAAGLLAFGSSAFAESPNNVGCGWGSMAFEGQSEKSSQVLAATTNNILGSQTFGISFGTAGCAQNGKVEVPARMAYIDSNIDRLARDMSVGKGETLQGLAAVIGIPEGERSAFYATTQRNFNEIYTSPDVTAEQVNANLHAVMERDQQLSQYAQL